MADSNTPIYSLILPEVGGADNTWGTSLNSNLTKLDQLLSGVLPLLGPLTIANSSPSFVMNDTDVGGAANGSTIFQKAGVAIAQVGPMGSSTGELRARSQNGDIVLQADYANTTANSAILFNIDGAVEVARINPTGAATVSTSLLTRDQSDARYLQLTGGTVTGQISGITPIAAAHLVRKDYVDTAVSAKVAKAGDTMTGDLSGITPTLAAHLTRKDYVDAQVATKITQAQGDARYLQLTGGAVTGQVSGITPTAAAHLTRKDYVDTAVSAKVNKAGDTMAGALLGVTPTAAEHLTRKDYVDTQVATKIGQAQGDARYLQITGGTVTGDLSGQTPTAAAHLTRKDYVDAQVASLLSQAAADARYLRLTGGTLSGNVAGVTPSLGSHLTRKDYVDTQVATRLLQADADLRYLQLSGGTLTANVSGVTPTAAAHLARKDYVDTKLALSGGVMTGLITGTAVTQSNEDTTADRLLKVGDFGLGSLAIGTLISNFDDTTLRPTGWYRFGGTATGARPPNAGTGWNGIVYHTTAQFGTDTQHQLAFCSANPLGGGSNYQTNGLAFRTMNSGAWSDWIMIGQDMQAGTAGAPFQRWAVDRTTGLYRAAAGVTAFSSAGVLAARVEAAGTTLANATSLVTREKGDARYLLSAASQTITTPKLLNPFVADVTDPTKMVHLIADSVSTGVTRNVRMPNASGTLALVGDIAPAINSAITGLDADNPVLAAWTPSLTFATPGDLVPAYGSLRSGNSISRQYEVNIMAAIEDVTMVHTTGSGDLRITGFPVNMSVAGFPSSIVATCRGLINIPWWAETFRFKPVAGQAYGTIVYSNNESLWDIPFSCTAGQRMFPGDLITTNNGRTMTVRHVKHTSPTSGVLSVADAINTATGQVTSVPSGTVMTSGTGQVYTSTGVSDLIPTVKVPVTAANIPPSRVISIWFGGWYVK